MAIVDRKTIRPDEQVELLVKKRRSTDVADVLKAAAMGYLLKKGFSNFDELGLVAWGGLRADVIALNLRGRIIICEIKSSPADYKTDKKWRRYTEYCDQLYFVFTEKTFAKLKARLKEDLKGTGAGVLVLSSTSGYLESKKSAKEQNMSAATRSTLITRMAWRGGVSKRTSRRTRLYIEQDKPREDQVSKVKAGKRKGSAWADAGTTGRSVRGNRTRAAAATPRKRRKPRRPRP